MIGQCQPITAKGGFFDFVRKSNGTFAALRQFSRLAEIGELKNGAWLQIHGAVFLLFFLYEKALFLRFLKILRKKGKYMVCILCFFFVLE